MRRKLPLASDHLLKLSEWIASAETQSDWSHPLKAFVKAIEAHGEIDTKDTALRLSLSDVARLFRNSHSKDLPKLAHQIEVVLGATAVVAAAPSAQAQTPRQSSGTDPTQPAPAGSPHVLVRLKQFLGIVPDD